MAFSALEVRGDVFPASEARGEGFPAPEVQVDAFPAPQVRDKGSPRAGGTGWRVPLHLRCGETHSLRHRYGVTGPPALEVWGNGLPRTSGARSTDTRVVGGWCLAFEWCLWLSENHWAHGSSHGDGCGVVAK